MRTMVVWVPDWPVRAARVASEVPAAVFHANRVVAANAAARDRGVLRRQRRREAQARCPALVVLDHDPDREARAFEPVLSVLEDFTPRLEVTRAGLAACPTRGPSRYFGGDDALAAQVVEAVVEVLGGAGGSGQDEEAVVAVGIADGPFAAHQAARMARARGGAGAGAFHVVAEGGSTAYLAPVSLHALDDPDLVEVLVRLGLVTLGDLAALDAGDVVARFGPSGARAHRVASGHDPTVPATVAPVPELAVAVDLDPPADTVAPVAFAARGLAESFQRGLAARGSACTRILVIAETANGERSERVWRHESSLHAGAIADRVRWQMDGWINASRHRRPTAGIVRVAIHPDEVVPAGGRQLGFWGGADDATTRALRAIARVQGLLGPESVFVPEYAGGREPGERLRPVPAVGVDLEGDRAGSHPSFLDAPWPGRLPVPSPATVLDRPERVDVLDVTGRVLVIDGRCSPGATPAVLHRGGRRQRIVGWAGPWPVDERWWDPERHRRRARFQILTEDGRAHLVVAERGRWSVVATYD